MVTGRSPLYPCALSQPAAKCFHKAKAGGMSERNEQQQSSRQKPEQGHKFQDDGFSYRSLAQNIRTKPRQSRT